MTLFQVAIVGTGGAGLLALLLLLQTKKCKPSDIVLIDPYHDGGDLQRKWAHVVSNTRWEQMLAILDSFGIARDSLPEPWKSLDPKSPTQLQHYIQLLRYLVKPVYRECECVLGTCTQIEEKDGHIVLTLAGKESQTVSAKVCLVCTGADAKKEPFPIPTLPLEIALDPAKLNTYIQPTDKVLVFGTAHSGTLVIKNLHQLNVEHAAFYRGQEPFVFARDGHYDGIKQESESIADDILAGRYLKTNLFPLTNTAQLLRWSRKADWIVYAIGFERRSFGAVNEYDGKTGQCKGYTRVWGFGIGFPNQAPDGQHWDVSLPSFFAHIQRQIPQIVESFYV